MYKYSCIIFENSSLQFTWTFSQSPLVHVWLKMFLCSVFYNLLFINYTCGCAGVVREVVFRLSPGFNTNQDAATRPVQFQPFIISSPRPRYFTTQATIENGERINPNNCSCGILNNKALNPKPYIVGGERTPPFLYPWMVMIGGACATCGGSLISDREDTQQFFAIFLFTFTW